MPAASESASVKRSAFLARLQRHLHISEVWMRFLVAIVGLGLAFGAALFSTVSRESGNVWATAILAGGALLLAVLVGLTTVPYLARRVVSGACWQDAFDFEVTRAGIAYVLLTLLISVAALNTGNNLLYVVVSALLAGMLASGMASATTLRRLELDVHLPQRVFAQQTVAGSLILRNPRSWLPSLSVAIAAPPRRQSRRRWLREEGRFTFPPHRSPDAQWINLPDIQLRRVSVTPDPPPVFEGSAYFSFIAARSVARADLQLRFPHRGRFQQQALLLTTRFPFGLLTKRRRITVPHEVIVYPAVRNLASLFPEQPRLSGELEALVRGQGSDLYAIRESQPQDSARFVDWKATAKSGQLKVREFTREDDRQLCLVFDNPLSGLLAEERYERAVSLAASLAAHFGSNSATFTFWVGDAETRDAHAFLLSLALIEPASTPCALEKLPSPGHFYVIVTARNPESLPAALRRTSILVPAGGLYGPLVT
jgi:uncharacterized protein (DUF58 family)